MNNDLIRILLDILVAIFGVLLVFFTLSSAIRTFVLPRGEHVHLTEWILSLSRMIFGIRQVRARTYEERDRVMSFFAPFTLLFIPVVWVILLILGYACIYWALGIKPWNESIEISGSSLLTLGTVPFISLWVTLVEFSQATIGLGIVALLIAYLPTMYAAFSQRESLVTMLEVRAGAPPSATEFILRMHRNGGLNTEYLNAVWREWEMWFTQLEESHTSLGMLVFFRSPNPMRSWITAAGTVLDSAALVDSIVDIPVDFQQRLTIRAGYVALRSIADQFNMTYNPNPASGDPISVDWEEFREVYETLQAAGVPLRSECEDSWKNFTGWRVNYDAVLIKLAMFIQAPYAPWISDRSLPQ